MSFKVKDHYFKKAKKEKFLARSVYKLEEIDKKYRIVNRGNIVLDLGYYPGSWIQYLSKQVGPNGRVVGIDIKEVNTQLSNVNNVSLYQEDVFKVFDLKQLGVEESFDVLLSDMAPNTTGIKSVDQLQSLNLVEMVFSLLPRFLKKNGNLIVKVFESHQAQVFLKEQKKCFEELHYLRPKSTRSSSKEFFVIAKNYKKIEVQQKGEP